MTNRKLTVVGALVAGLPSISWVASLALSWISTGSPLATSPIAYAPLLVVTFPMSDLFNVLVNRLSNVHVAAVLYTGVCSFVYAAAFAVILAPVLVSNKMKQRNHKGNECERVMRVRRSAGVATELAMDYQMAKRSAGSKKGSN